MPIDAAYLLATRFPNASRSCLEANGARENAAPKSDSRTKSLAKGEAKEASAVRFLVRVTSIRKRLADEDGIIGKYHVDCLRYAGFIPNDCPAVCSIVTTQRKPAKGESEGTMIEVYRSV